MKIGAKERSCELLFKSDMVYPPFWHQDNMRTESTSEKTLLLACFMQLKQTVVELVTISNRQINLRFKLSEPSKFTIIYIFLKR